MSLYKLRDKIAVNMTPAQVAKAQELTRKWRPNGFRVIARKQGKRVRLYSRPGNDLTHRFPLIVEGAPAL